MLRNTSCTVRCVRIFIVLTSAYSILNPKKYQTRVFLLSVLLFILALKWSLINKTHNPVFSELFLTTQQNRVKHCINKDPVLIWYQHAYRVIWPQVDSFEYRYEHPQVALRTQLRSDRTTFGGGPGHLWPHSFSSVYACVSWAALKACPHNWRPPWNKKKKPQTTGRMDFTVSTAIFYLTCQILYSKQ